MKLLIYQVYEETGYDIASLAEPDAFIEGVLNYQYTRLYLIRNVPIETVFVPRTRKEIKCCEWFSVEHLPTHKTDRVSRNHLGINANSFFMIMPFVKRLKKWINEQLQGTGTTSDKLKLNECKSAFTNVSATGSTPINEQNGSATNVYFKNNVIAAQRRQRHKSMGDLDSTNVVTHNSNSGEMNNNQISCDSETIGTNGDVGGSGGATTNNNDTNGVVKLSSGKRKLFPSTTINADSSNNTALNRSSSPMYANFQLQPVPQHMKYYYNNQTMIANMNGIAKSGPQNQFIKPECNKKKKNVINQTTDGDVFSHLYNPTTLSQLLCNEPSINKWRNVRLNKEVIMHESLKLSSFGK